MMVVDQDARAQALSTTESFIVQAPAGSGKTELLTQRFLALLAVVEAPEQIVALTFTRKAAQEMRERVLSALQQARANTPITSEHQAKTRVLAEAALVQDDKLHWQLLDSPSRLRMMTIDSLCQRLCHSIPVTERSIPFAKPADDPSLLYEAAIEDFFEHGMNEVIYQPDFQRLLLHCNNHLSELKSLLLSIVSNRDEWQHVLFSLKDKTKAELERNLRYEQTRLEEHMRHILPKTSWQMLISLVEAAAAMIGVDTHTEHPLQHWQHDITHLQALAQLLLTSDGKQLRKSLDHHVGLTAQLPNQERVKTIKAESKALFEVLSTELAFVETLRTLRRLPEQIAFSDEEWALLQAVFNLLPVLLACLHIRFQESGSVDFNSLSEQAELALGSPDNPTDLSMYLDYQIQHLLIDEFQDTSEKQMRLLELLVANWSPFDAKTLFLVGDPMQSIYRFRQAEVGLFLQVKERGIGRISLRFLQLLSNFRSSATIVDWINRQFWDIFPKNDNMTLGAVSFAKASPTRPALDTHFIKATVCPSKRAEAQALALLCAELTERYPKDNVAILVRSRTQLGETIRALRQAGLAFQGLDIDALASLEHIHDLYLLLKAFAYPEHRLHCLAFLRSPWVGLSLADLLVLTKACEPQKSLWPALRDAENLSLSDSAKRRLRFITPHMQNAFLGFGQERLSVQLRTLFDALQGKALYGDAFDSDFEAFYALVDKQASRIMEQDLARFETALNALFAKRDDICLIQIMTIHRAKGLEFDTVILPGLSYDNHQIEKSLFRIQALDVDSQNRHFLIAPNSPLKTKSSPLYDYLGYLDGQKDKFEQQRLLYVACTRAKKRLYLFDSSEKGAKRGFRGLLQNQPFEEMALDNPAVSPEADIADTQTIWRLPDAFYPESGPLTEPPKPSFTRFINESSLGLVYGSICHRLIQWLCHNPVSDIQALPWYWVADILEAQGFIDQHQAVEAQLKSELSYFFEDPRGRWIRAEQQSARSEWALSKKTEFGVERYVLDRYFIDQGVHWVIDFKTGRQDANRHPQYQKQVTHYASLIHQMHQAPVRCGLLYLGDRAWIEWPYEYYDAKLAAN